MQFQTMGTVSNYIRMMKLDMKYQKRKENPWMKKGDENEDPVIRQIKEQAEQTRKSNTLESIMGKVKAGMRLSNAEIEYLQENHPDAYWEVLEIEKERAEYRRELEQCKTKEDVRKLNQRKMTQFQAEAKAIVSNPNIPRDQKAGLLEKIQMRMANIQNEHGTFINTPEYKSLPKDDREQERDEKQGASPPDDHDSVKDLLKDIKLRDSGEMLEGMFGDGAAGFTGEAAGTGEADAGEIAEKVKIDDGSPGWAVAPGAVQTASPYAAERASVIHAVLAYGASRTPAKTHTGTAHAISVKV